ncbi:hypothetical protein RUM43_000391 [Polyplax serrata]|uniref:ATPase dynein-related AAA domain-containing protein n=1 Tax=Polyplax serrata TaxID=468196 RepID=A0AAN8XNH7_POLSC
MSILKEIAPNADFGKINQLLSCGHALISEESVSLGLPDFPVDNIPKLGEILQKYPSARTIDLLTRLYPYNSFLQKEGKEAVRHILNSFQVKEIPASGNKLTEVKCSSNNNMATCDVSLNSAFVQAQVPCGHLPTETVSDSYIPTDFQENLIVELLQSHSVCDFCIIGPKGCGKSATVFRLANLLNYDVESVVLYQDITSRDLVQQRTTLANGDTVWNNSPLIQAALDGKLAILEGIDQVHPSTLSVIHSLVHDRDIQLYDGKRLVRHDRYEEIKKRNNMTDEDMSSSQILKVHPSFRIVAIADSQTKGVAAPKWLSPEMLSLFLFHEMRPLSYAEESHIIQKLFGSINDKTKKVMNLAVALRNSEDPTLASLSGSFSTRQLLRIAKRLSSYPQDSVYESIQKACLARFLPPITKEAFDNSLKKQGIEPDSPTSLESITCQVTDETVKIGNTEAKRYVTKAKSKVPDILFYDIPQHLALLEWLIQDFSLGEHLLLVGNQGVGKNKIADRLLQLLNRPREYIQLHRDTTVQTLTLQPTMKKGIVSYEDSPLVQAVKNGHVLVIDEADKAPTHVTCILKTLVERSEMTLSDGRKIIPHGDRRKDKPNTIEVHPDFRMIVLANRPGFPFLGNDFFGALGDLFSCHTVDNPSTESEISLLKQYGPNVPEDVILKLVKAFGELRDMADKGLVQYPYSTREVVNVVKHLENFPDEGITDVVGNVFDFDKYSSNALETVLPVLQKHGIPINRSIKDVSLAREYPLPKISNYGTWDISAVIPYSDNPVTVKNIKIVNNKTLESTKTELDITELRGTMFSELQSYATIPLPPRSVVLGAAVTKGSDTSKQLVNVIGINPFRLYVTRPASSEVKIISMESFTPKILPQSKYKFNLVPLAGHLSNCLLVQEESTNYLILVNNIDNSVGRLDLTSTSEKLMKTLGKTFVGQWKLNKQLSKENIVILYSLRHGLVQMLDLNESITYTLELPLKIKSLQVVSADRWLLQTIDDSKYLLSNKTPQDPMPSLLRSITEKVKSDFSLGTITATVDFDLGDDVLSTVLGQKISSPNRLFVTEECHAAVAVGFPELECSTNDIYCWARPQNVKGWTGAQGESVFLGKASQVVTPVSKILAPRDVQNQQSTIGFLEILDLKRRKLQYIPVPQGSSTWYIDNSTLGIFLCDMSDERLVTVDLNGNIRIWETSYMQLQRSLDDWQKMVGKAGEGSLRLTIDRPSGKDVSEPKHGKVDPENKPHVGGNTWAGGTGGRDTAGLGGKGGPYRLDAGHDVHQIPDIEKDNVPEEVKRAAREMGQKAFQQRLKEIRMSQYDHELYLSYYEPVAKQVKMLKVVIDSMQAKSKERDWVRHQTSGDLDDLKLIEGLTGEKTIYRRRAKKEPDPGTPQTKPKRLKLVADVSGSMYRFNGYDGRLNRMLEASVLVMEAFENQEVKFIYDITGHSGDGYNIPFVEVGKAPKNNKERLEVIKTMHAHSQFCMSGDHTLPATAHAIESLAQEDCDEAIVIVLSDANLERYGIQPARFGQILTSNPDVGAYAILIGSLGDQATRLAATLPAGRAFVCMDLSNIPQIMRQIFTTSVLSSA